MCPSCMTAEALPIVHVARGRGEDTDIRVPPLIVWAAGLAFGAVVLLGLVSIARR